MKSLALLFVQKQNQDQRDTVQKLGLKIIGILKIKI
jgi:hypothetical protein